AQGDAVRAVRTDAQDVDASSRADLPGDGLPAADCCDERSVVAEGESSDVADGAPERSRKASSWGAPEGDVVRPGREREQPALGADVPPGGDVTGAGREPKRLTETTTAAHVPGDDPALDAD